MQIWPTQHNGAISATCVRAHHSPYQPSPHASCTDCCVCLRCGVVRLMCDMWGWGVRWGTGRIHIWHTTFWESRLHWNQLTSAITLKPAHFSNRTANRDWWQLNPCPLSSNWWLRVLSSLSFSNLHKLTLGLQTHTADGNFPRTCSASNTMTVTHYSAHLLLLLLIALICIYTVQVAINHTNLK